MSTQPATKGKDKNSLQNTQIPANYTSINPNQLYISLPCWFGWRWKPSNGPVCARDPAASFSPIDFVRFPFANLRKLVNLQTNYNIHNGCCSSLRVSSNPYVHAFPSFFQLSTNIQPPRRSWTNMTFLSWTETNVPPNGSNITSVLVKAPLSAAAPRTLFTSASTLRCRRDLGSIR